MYKRLLIYVEGINDKRFFDKVIVPKFLELGYDHIAVEEYKGDNYKAKCKKISSFIKNIDKINNKPDYTYHYIFCADSDHYRYVIAKKNAISSRIRDIDDDRIVVVIIEIEGWYLAGLDKHSSIKHDVPNFSNTNNITKEMFLDVIPNRYKKLEIPFRLKILDDFCFDTAKNKNESFRFFHDNFLI